MTTTEHLNIAVISLDIRHADKVANIQAATLALRSIAHSDTHIAILPELFSTGPVNDLRTARSLAETIDDSTIATLKHLSLDTGIAICGSFICISPDSDSLLNRCFFITPQSQLFTYDKRHLFILGEESHIFTPGTSPSPIIQYLGWNISMACCYDLRFPCWLRNHRIDNHPAYDLMLIPANWPAVRAYAWHHLLVARAIENQAYVIGANRSGTDATGSYTGLSEIIDYNGRPLTTSTSTSISTTTSTSISASASASDSTSTLIPTPTSHDCPASTATLTADSTSTSACTSTSTLTPASHECPASTADSDPQILSATLSLTKLNIHRRAFPAWRSAD